MKRIWIGAIVGGIIIFLWQFLTWGALNLHKAQQQYTPKQDSILAYLNSQFSEDGAYMLPTFAPGISDAEMETQMKAMEGKPWAQVVYHKSMPGMNKMFMNIGRSLLVDIVIAWMLIWVLMKIPSPSFQTIFLATFAVGLIVFFTMPYTMHIWYGSFDLMIHFLDTIITWSLVGAWLGWWLRRKTYNR